MSHSLLQTLNSFFESHEFVLDWSHVSLSKKIPHSEELKTWIENKWHGEMSFMENNLELRLDPTKIEPWAKSMVLFLFPYPEKLQKYNSLNNKPIISAYAKGIDYHTSIRSLIAECKQQLLKVNESIKLRPFVDSAPIFERDWALLAGLGWVGKNACLINKKIGSSFFIGGFLLDEGLPSSLKTAQDFCGKCTLCIDACPTDAIEQPYQVNGSKCISYFTIEKKGVIPSPFGEKLGNQLFGCDICQQVCPWNHKHLIPEQESIENTFLYWLTILKKGGGFKSKYKTTPLYRAGRKKLLRNLAHVYKNAAEEQYNELWREVLKDESQEDRSLIETILF